MGQRVSEHSSREMKLQENNTVTLCYILAPTLVNVAIQVASN